MCVEAVRRSVYDRYTYAYARGTYVWVGSAVSRERIFPRTCSTRSCQRLLTEEEQGKAQWKRQGIRLGREWVGKPGKTLFDVELLFLEALDWLRRPLQSSRSFHLPFLSFTFLLYLRAIKEEAFDREDFLV